MIVGSRAGPPIKKMRVAMHITWAQTLDWLLCDVIVKYGWNTGEQTNDRGGSCT